MRYDKRPRPRQRSSSTTCCDAFFLRSSVEGQIFSSDRHLAVCRDRYLYLFSVRAHIHFGIHVQIYDRKALHLRFLTWSARSNIAPHTVSFCRCPSTCCISIAPFSFSCAHKPILIKFPPTGTNTCVEDIQAKKESSTKGVKSIRGFQTTHDHSSIVQRCRIHT